MKKRKVQEESDNEDNNKEEQGLAKISSRHSTRDLPCKLPE